MVLFCGLLLPYVVLGALFQKYRRQSEGRDLMVHRAFWGEVPGLFKDGVQFTVFMIRAKCFKGHGGNYETL